MYSFELPQQGNSNEYQQNLSLFKLHKTIFIICWLSDGQNDIMKNTVVITNAAICEADCMHPAAMLFNGPVHKHIKCLISTNGPHHEKTDLWTCATSKDR